MNRMEDDLQKTQKENSKRNTRRRNQTVNTRLTKIENKKLKSQVEEMEQKQQQQQQQARKVQEENNRLKQQLHKRGVRLLPRSNTPSGENSENSDDVSQGDGSISFGDGNNNDGILLREGRLMTRSCKNDSEYMNGFIKLFIAKQNLFATYFLTQQLLYHQYKQANKSIDDSVSQSVSMSGSFDIPNKPLRMSISGPNLKPPDVNGKRTRRSRFAPISNNNNNKDNKVATSGSNKDVAKEKVPSDEVKFFVFLFFLFILVQKYTMFDHSMFFLFDRMILHWK